MTPPGSPKFDFDAEQTALIRQQAELDQGWAVIVTELIAMLEESPGMDLYEWIGSTSEKAEEAIEENAKLTCPPAMAKGVARSFGSMIRLAGYEAIQRVRERALIDSLMPEEE